MSEVVQVTATARRPIDATVTLPGSKSYTNRALIIAAMAEGEALLRHALFSDDTDYMAAALRSLGIAVDEDRAAETFRVHGGGGRFPVPEATLFIGNAGTAARFLTSYVALGERPLCHRRRGAHAPGGPSSSCWTACLSLAWMPALPGVTAARRC